MRIRRMAVTTAAVAAAVTGVVVVQSGIPGTGMLPIVRDAGAPAATEGPGLPAPGETVLAPPSAGVVQDASATVVRTGTRPAGGPAATEHRSGEDQRSRSDRKSKADSGSKGKEAAKDKAAEDKPSKDKAGKGDSGGEEKPAKRRSKDG